MATQLLIQSLKSTYIKSSCNIDLYLTKYDQLLFLGDFNVGIMTNKPPCFKNHDKTSCIDLILTNCPRSFQNSCAVRTGLTDFHKLAVSVLKATYKNFHNQNLLPIAATNISIMIVLEKLCQKQKTMEKTAMKILIFYLFMQYYSE